MSSDERFLVISLRRLYDGRRAQRAARAVRRLKEMLRRRLHAEVVKLDDSVNRAIWGRGIERPPRSIRLKVRVEEKEEVKTKEGKTLVIPKVVRVSLQEESGEGERTGDSDKALG